jgi:hypothetical protein
MLHQSTGRDRKREPSNSYVPLSETNGTLAPDFLWLALAKFMRLSLMKAAHAVVSSAAPREIRVLTND